MWTSYLLFFPAIISSVAVEATTLSEALRNAGASDFATQIESDPASFAFFNSIQVQTVFAPIDGSTSLSQSKAKRQNYNDALAYQTSLDRTTEANMLRGGGQPLRTNARAPNVAGGRQAVVSNSKPFIPSKRSVLPTNTTSNSSSLNIFSGLGRNVSIIQADILYDGGVIHIVDGLFTTPSTLSATAITNGQTTFASLGNSTNTSTINDNTPSITAFIPFNAAFSASNTTNHYSSSINLLSGHIIPNFLGYLPSLVDGSTFMTQGGTNVTITIRGGHTFVNNAKIIQSNQILQNGVAHVIDSIIVPSPSTPLVSFTGSASSTKIGGTMVVSVLLVSITVFLV